MCQLCVLSNEWVNAAPERRAEIDAELQEPVNQCLQASEGLVSLIESVLPEGFFLAPDGLTLSATLYTCHLHIEWFKRMGLPYNPEVENAIEGIRHQAAQAGSPFDFTMFGIDENNRVTVDINAPGFTSENRTHQLLVLGLVENVNKDIDEMDPDLIENYKKETSAQAPSGEIDWTAVLGALDDIS